MNKTITKDTIKNSLSFEDFISLMTQLMEINKTTGNEQTEEKIKYNKINLQRIIRSEKTFVLLPETERFIRSIKSRQYWLIIVEAWCGDVSQNLAPIYNLSKLNPLISFHIILRDDNPDIINNYLTEGSQSIPKLIILDENLNELAVWGPRPQGGYEILKRFKTNSNITKEEFHHDLHLWYFKDRGIELQKEIVELVKESLKRI